MLSGYKIGDSRVVESRELGDGDTIRRRRETLDGKYRFTTYERIERPPVMVVKRSGSRELFDQSKLLDSTRKSVGKFFNSDSEVEAVVSQVEDMIYRADRNEVTSEFIGQKVLEVLADVNEVAYVRFASVFLRFKSIDEFEQILRDIRRRAK